MPLRHIAVAALALAVIGPALPAASATTPPPPPKPAVKELPRPGRPAQNEEAAFDPHTVLVRFKSGASAAAKDRALSGLGARRVGAVPGTGYVKVRSETAAAGLLRGLRKDPAVARVSLDYERQISATPNDAAYYFGDQNYLKTVRLPQAWDRTKGSTSQVIAVVDTGVNGLHEDLKGRTVGGYNAIANTAIAAGAASDDNGHGSMVAGIAAANTNNTVGIAGVAWTGRVMPVKVLDKNGLGYDSDIAEGVIWAADHGAKIINLSLGGPSDGAVLHDAIAYATGRGALVVTAAGNDGDDRPQYPAAYPEALAVGATDTAGNLTDFSSWGDWIDVAAPGFGIVSTGLSQDYYLDDGTSFSAPIVSGVAALVRTLYPTMTPAQVISRLKTTARDAGPRGIDPYYGYGVLDAYAAVGGTWTTDFAQRALGTGEPNDVPARATVFSTSVTGTAAMEGDVDWYRYASTAQGTVTFTVKPPALDLNRPQNFDPVLAVYNQDLRLVGWMDSPAADSTETLSLVLGAGSYYVSVSNYNGAADTRAYTLTAAPAAAPPFNPAVSTPVGSQPETVAIGDVTGDGRTDVLLSTSGIGADPADNSLFVFAGRADGSLAPPVRYAKGAALLNRAAIAVLDANGDQRLDVAASTAAGVQIFRQTETGTLESAGVLPGTAGAGVLVAADVDGDHDEDLVTVADAGILLLSQDATGAFAPSTVTADTTPEVEVGDIDGDGRLDIVGFQNAAVRAYHRTDTGWNRTDHGTGATAPIQGIEVADVTGDGRADIMATILGNAPDSKLSLLVQNAAGGLNPPVLKPVLDLPKPVEAADVDGDSGTDVVIAHETWRAVSVLAQQADGTLGTPLTSAVAPGYYNVQGLALGDINGDGRIDAAIADNHGLQTLYSGRAPAPGLDKAFVRGVSPADFGTGLAVGTVPTVTFAPEVDPASVTDSTVRLVHGRTGATVPAAISYDGTARLAKLTPAAPLQDNTPYRILVTGVRDTVGDVQAGRFTTTFRTADLAPPPVSDLKATGGIGTATVSWTRPAITDLDQVIVRRATGTTPPSSPTAGTAVYAGTGTSATATGLTTGTTYTFRAWVRDRSGKYSATAPTTSLVGSRTTISSNIATLTYGSAVTVTGKVVRASTGAAIAGATVQLYGRRKGTTTWTLLGTATSSAYGNLSYSHKPSWSLDYKWIYRNATGYLGSESSLRAVGVRTSVSAALSATSVALGGSVTLSGTVSPSHAGKTVYLQRYVNGAWTSITSRALSSTSTYAFTIKPAYRGTYSYRVYMPADTDHLAGYSASRTLKIY